MTSTWRAPAWTAASVLAVASPRSLWQWTLTVAWSADQVDDALRQEAELRGIAYPTVSGILTVDAPASTTAS